MNVPLGTRVSVEEAVEVAAEALARDDPPKILLGPRHDDRATDPAVRAFLAGVTDVLAGRGQPPPVLALEASVADDLQAGFNAGELTAQDVSDAYQTRALVAPGTWFLVTLRTAEDLDLEVRFVDDVSADDRDALIAGRLRQIEGAVVMIGGPNHIGYLEDGVGWVQRLAGNPTPAGIPEYLGGATPAAVDLDARTRLAIPFVFDQQEGLFNPDGEAAYLPESVIVIDLPER